MKSIKEIGFTFLVFLVITTITENTTSAKSGAILLPSAANIISVLLVATGFHFAFKFLFKKFFGHESSKKR